MTSNRVEDFKLEDWLPYWINPNDLIALFAALAVLVAFLAIWQALRPADPFQRRYSQVMQRREGVPGGDIDGKPRAPGRSPPGGGESEGGGRANQLWCYDAEGASTSPGLGRRGSRLRRFASW